MVYAKKKKNERKSKTVKEKKTPDKGKNERIKIPIALALLHTIEHGFRPVWRSESRVATETRARVRFHVYRFIAQFVKFLSRNWHRVTLISRQPFEIRYERTKEKTGIDHAKRHPFFFLPCTTMKRWISVFFSFFSLSFNGSVHRLDVIHLRQIGRLSTAQKKKNYIGRSIDRCPRALPITRTTMMRKNIAAGGKSVIRCRPPSACASQPHKLTRFSFRSLFPWFTCVLPRRSPFVTLYFPFLSSICAVIFCGSVLATAVGYRASRFHTHILTGVLRVYLVGRLFVCTLHTAILLRRRFHP